MSARILDLGAHRREQLLRREQSEREIVRRYYLGSPPPPRRLTLDEILGTRPLGGDYAA